MYKFVDTVASPGAVSSMPAEAVKFNGVWLDEEVPGFRTLQVSGRELMECEITDEQMGSMNGTHYQYKRYPPRTITVTYQLIAESDKAFREAYNQLNSLLSAEQTELLFNDESDKFFVATKASNSEVPAGTDYVTGEIYFYCTDPFKYSVVEKIFPASLNEDGVLEAIIVNEGTEAVPISYDITMNSENGFIGIISEHGVMQYGYVDEADMEERQRSETLISHKGQTDFATKMLADSRVTFNDSSWSGTLSNLPKWNGTIGKYNYKNEYGSKTWNCLRMTNQGSSAGLKNGQWHGANMTFALPTKSDGTYPDNFEVTTYMWMTGARQSQRGGAMLVIIDEDNKILASMWWWDGSTVAGSGRLRVDVQNHGRVFYIEEFWSDVDGGAGIRTRVNGGGIVRIRKAGAKFTFNYCGTERSFSFNDLKGKRISKVALAFTQVKPTTDLVTRLDFLNSFKVVANNVSYIYDIPNRYQPDDVITIDGLSGKVYKNGSLDLEDEIVGTTYFKAKPGVTKVQFTNSDWASNISAAARIREAYL